jgi:DNA-binding transcriptional LysR family regulator
MLTYRLPRILGQFRAQYPHVNVIFRPYWDDKLTGELESGQLDLGIRMIDRIEAESLRSECLRTEKVYYIAPPGHPLCAMKNVQPQDLAGQVLLLTEAGCSYRKKLDQLLVAQSIRPENIIEFTSVEAIKQCVIAGMGLGLLPEIAVHAEIESGNLKALDWAGPSADIATYVVWHKDKWISPSMNAFLTLLQADLQNDVVLCA